MADETKKRTRRPGVVRVALTFSDEEKLAIGGGVKADNATITKWVEGQVEHGRITLLKSYYQSKLDSLA